MEIGAASFQFLISSFSFMAWMRNGEVEIGKWKMEIGNWKLEIGKSKLGRPVSSF